MSGITAVYVVFAIVIASIFGYVFLLSRRQREVELELDDLQARLAEKGKGR
ncbi:MAG: CcmD family protein [Dehalococcoidia bacterium]|nr:CcmD family protein [Dehalococcoidia bacterium]